MRLLGQALAQQIDVELMGPAVGFSIDQLMELAGLSVAQAVAREYTPATHRSILVCAGPGNNGGDALVAARHLRLFGFAPTVHFPKRPSKDLFVNLVKQCTAYGIPFVDEIETPLKSSQLVLDGIFGGPRSAMEARLGDESLTPWSWWEPGFSFSGDIRAPFDSIIRVSNVGGIGLEPEMLVSLTSPKMGVRGYRFKHHYLGGRFVPPALAEKFSLNLPAFPGTDGIVRLDDVVEGEGPAESAKI
nr:NAD(P)H-hydrate epimerase [Polyrhizophydium stewartii]